MFKGNIADFRVHWSWGGVYAITNLLTGDQYIGRAERFRDRWASHRQQLRKGRHKSKSMQEAFDTWGEDAFRFDVVEIANRSDSRRAEPKWLINLSPAYNRKLPTPTSISYAIAVASQ